MNASVARNRTHRVHQCVRDCDFYLTNYTDEDLQGLCMMLCDKYRGSFMTEWIGPIPIDRPVIQFTVCECGVQDVYLMCTALEVVFTLCTKTAELLWHDMLQLGQEHMHESYEEAGEFLSPLYSAG